MMHFRLSSVICIFCLLSYLGFSQPDDSYSLEVTPRYLRVNPEIVHEGSLLCILQDPSGKKVPLSGCEFMSYYKQTLWEFNLGLASAAITHGDYIGRYHGRGLQHGECGLTISGFRWEDELIIGCRVRATEGGTWIYEKMMIDVEPLPPLQFHLQPPGVTLALAGSDVTFNGVAEHELIVCFFALNPSNSSIEFDFDDGHASANHSLARYYGAGLDHKQCGVTLVNVQPERSGFVRGWAQSGSPGSGSNDFVELIVATAPKVPPLLTVNTTGILSPGDALYATCVVKNSRPVANITWYVGDDVVRGDSINEAPLDSQWRWSHDFQTIEQHLEYIVTPSDDFKRLKCKASHLTLGFGTQDTSSHIIRVRASSSANPCLATTCGNHSVCHAEGLVAVCSCQRYHIGSPPSCMPECFSNTDCSPNRACVDTRCVDVCKPATCGRDAVCLVEQHRAVCKCPVGLLGDPRVHCQEEKCGRREVNPRLIGGGQNANYGEFPWHAGIYQQTTLRDDTTRYGQICGGTLIRADIVITAAHCVYEEGYQRVYPKENYAVALGKIHRDWDVDMNISDVQRMRVDDIHVHRDFRGDDFAFRYDIAILKLSSSAVMTRQVQVACVDWDNKFEHVQLVTGSNGTVAGFGKTNLGPASSEELQWLDLPWVDFDTCRAATHLRRRKYLSSDKFCAGYVDRGMSVCGGDSGGGLLFFNATSSRFYLRGVVSTGLSYNVAKISCHSDHYTLFTKLSDFVGWVGGYLRDN